MDRSEWMQQWAERHEEKRREAAELAAGFGARIERRGQAWRVVGPTVDILIDDLRHLRREDFQPI